MRVFSGVVPVRVPALPEVVGEFPEERLVRVLPFPVGKLPVGVLVEVVFVGRQVLVQVGLHATDLRGFLLQISP